MEIALVLVPAFCLLSGAYAQERGITFASGSFAGRAGSCVTIPCSFTYPAGRTVSAVIWTRDDDETVYHSEEARVHAAFKGRARYLGDLQRDCSLRVSGLRPSDQGTYRFRFEVVRPGSSDRWTMRTEQCLRHPPCLGSRVHPGTCSCACPPAAGGAGRRHSLERAHRGVPGLSGWHRAIPHLQQAHEHGESTAGAELSRRPETESPYEELQGRTEDIYSELVYPQAGSH
ncbi:sialic acid-binding Ig-like lectin 12 isoform X2 [Natator depressus]|uniref:sialic acid-binding Ig-like lectin 12 isoform X2 n=1 Tax=Natator depressus TaxID=27790 RepID=UPI003EBE6748